MGHWAQLTEVASFTGVAGAPSSKSPSIPIVRSLDS